MRKFLILIPVVTLLAACGSAPKETYDRRAYEIQQKQEKYTERAIDKAPKWMTDLPKSNSAVYANGTSVSSDLGMADEKAKVMAFGKICMAAGGEVDQNSRVFRSDVGDQSVENSSVAIRSMCRTVDVTGAEIIEIKRIAEGHRFRSYVLVALPTGAANPIQQRRDQNRAQRSAQSQSDAAFRELDQRPPRRD
jgi:hypothetical protein